MRELRGPKPPVLPRGPELFSREGAGGATGWTEGISDEVREVDCIISMPWRSVSISRRKQATAEAAEPFSLEKSKRRTVASPATWAAWAMGSDVLAA